MVKLTQNWGMDDLGPCVLNCVLGPGGQRSQSRDFYLQRMNPKGSMGQLVYLPTGKPLKKKSTT